MITDIIFAGLFNESERLKKDTAAYSKKRALFGKVKATRNLMAGIYGLRGTGKTTIMLQLALERENSIYVNAESLIFKDISIVEFVEFAEKKGFEHFFIDEIHEYSDWSRELKLLYDRGFHNIVFSGSSSLKIQERAADLSRRALLFCLQPLSFREFLELGPDAKIELVSFNDVLDFGKRKEMMAALAPYAGQFDEYMRAGTLPVYFSQKENAFQLYARILEKIVRVDLASIGKIDADYIGSVYKLINTLAISNPNEMNYNFLAGQIKRNIYLTETIIRNLGEIGFINMAKPFKKGAALVRKESKFLIAPPFRLTIANGLGMGFEQVIGGIREDIFVANTLHLNPRYVKTDRERKTPDYIINNLCFELGTHKYKYGTDFYVKDQMVIDEKTIPLPLFCMLV